MRRWKEVEGEKRRRLSTEHKRVRKLLLESLSVCKPKTQVGSAQSVPKRKEKLRVLIVKGALLRRISPTFLASKLVQDENLAGCPEGLDNKCHVKFFPLVLLKVIRHFSPSTETAGGSVGNTVR